jgi:hypothetical protein
MTAPTTAVFTCSICGEPSSEICAYCTKDACHNHRCNRCKRCSDCCECEVPLSEVEDEVELAAEPVVIVPEPLEPELITPLEPEPAPVPEPPEPTEIPPEYPAYGGEVPSE